MMDLEVLADEDKEKIMQIWREMTESDKAHFINQVALGLSVWGSDSRGKEVVIQILDLMMSNGTTTLADFGLYVDEVRGLGQYRELDEKIKRAGIIIEGYRIKNALPSEPHRELLI